MSINMDKDKTDQELITSPSVSEKEPHSNLDSKNENGGDESSSLGIDKDSVEDISKAVTQKDKCTCQCECQERLKKLENEMNDLKSWKVGRQKLDDIITNWKKDVESWVQTTFGYSFSGCLSKSNDDENGIEGSASSANVVFTGESLDTKAGEENNKEEANVVLDAGDTENVEITPDLFGHFLLDNEYDYGESDNNNEEFFDESLGDEEEESGVPLEKPTKRRKHNNDETESECYTLSSSSSSEDITSSEDEYEPQRKRGRGRGRGKFSTNPSLQTKHLTSTSTSNVNSSGQLGNKPSANSMVDLGSAESRKELLKYCRKRQGNIWECTVCGFMLTSFENMLLHIKYNHSSSTHTCPYCRIVVLCRSPKDAVVHQSQCKMKPANNTNDNKTLDAKTGPIQTQKVIAAAAVTNYNNTNNKPKPNIPNDVHEEVDKFIDDILRPGTSASTKNKIAPKNNLKKTETPTVVTLSSDSDDDDDSDDTDDD